VRIPKSLSPSAFMLWEKDPTEYTMKYLVDEKPPRDPQSLPMSVGSAFDAVVKSKLHSAIFGEGNDPQFEFDALFESQVESHNRDEARRMGLHVFEDYDATGSYQDLLDMMDGAQEAPRFEFDAGATLEGIPLFGKPDCCFINRDWVRVILDWKVRGYCSVHSASPTKGYLLCRDGLGWMERNFTKAKLKKIDAGIEGVVGAQSLTNGKPHKLVLPGDIKGFPINQGFLETCSPTWAIQLSIYSWITGSDVGDEDVAICLDEVACKYMGEGEKPLMRIANHRARISSTFQKDLFARIQKLWTAINDGHIFQEMTREDSDNLVTMLQARASGMGIDTGSEDDEWFANLGRPTY